jgi:hypothetical protein
MAALPLLVCLHNLCKQNYHSDESRLPTQLMKYMGQRLLGDRPCPRKGLHRSQRGFGSPGFPVGNPKKFRSEAPKTRFLGPHISQESFPGRRKIGKYFPQNARAKLFFAGKKPTNSFTHAKIGQSLPKKAHFSSFFDPPGFSPVEEPGFQTPYLGGPV